MFRLRYPLALALGTLALGTAALAAAPEPPTPAQAPNSAGYRACVDREIDARSQLLVLGDDQSGVNVAEEQ